MPATARYVLAGLLVWSASALSSPGSWQAEQPWSVGTMPDSSPLFESADDAANDEGTDLQFDHAELTTPVSAGPSCDVCKRPISDAYYEINGKVLCTSCRQRIEESLRGGSGLARFITAVVLGTGAAIVGRCSTSS